MRASRLRCWCRCGSGRCRFRCGRRPRRGGLCLTWRRFLPLRSRRRRFAGLVGTAVLVLVAVLGLRLVDAFVVLVVDPVVVVVGIGTAVRVLEAVGVFGLIRTLIPGVGNAVAVLV